MAVLRMRTPRRTLPIARRVPTPSRVSNDPSPVRKKNAQYWVEHELRQYPNYHWDLDAVCAHKGKLMLAVGEGSVANHQWTARPSLILAERCGLALLQVPGYHLGFL
jgi:hypothetical protein